MHAAAFVVGPLGGANALTHLVETLGFEAVLPYTGMAAAKAQQTKTPVLFFLTAADTSLRKLREVAHAIRFSTERTIRFSPLIHFAKSPSVETIKGCVGMGFDDVIALPTKPARLAERLLRQLDRPYAYFETSSYFGPDRRRQIEIASVEEESRGGGQFRRLEIIRNLMTGISVVRDDFEVMV